MYCENCGAELSGNFKFCPNCAKPIECETMPIISQNVENSNVAVSEAPEIIRNGVLVGKVSKKKKRLIRLIIFLVTAALVFVTLFCGYSSPMDIITPALLCGVCPIFIAFSVNKYLFGKKRIGKARRIICIILAIAQIFGSYVCINNYIKARRSANIYSYCSEIETDLKNFQYEAAEEKIDSMPKYMDEEKEKMEALLKVTKTIFSYEALLNNDPEQYIVDICNATIDYMNTEDYYNSEKYDLLKLLATSPSYVQDFYDLQKPAKAYYDYRVGKTTSVSNWKLAREAYDNTSIVHLQSNIYYHLDNENEFDAKAISKFNKFNNSGYSIDWIISDNEFDGEDYYSQLHFEIDWAIDDGFETGNFSLKNPEYDYQPKCAYLVYGMYTQKPVCSEDDMQENAQYADLSFRLGLAYALACDEISYYFR